MAKQNLNIGSSANDGTGDSLRDGAIKLNSVINELYTNLGNDTNLQINVGSPTQGQLLKWNGAQFAEGGFNSFTEDVDVNDFSIISSANGDITLKPNGTGDVKFWAANTGSALTYIDGEDGKLKYSNHFPTVGDLPDVNSHHGMFAYVSADGKPRVASSTAWVPIITEQSGLGSLGDVDMTVGGGPSGGQVIKWNGSTNKWEPANEDSSGGGGGGTTQNLFEGITADTGSTTASAPTDVLTVAGGTNISTTIVGDTLTIAMTGTLGDPDQNLYSVIGSDSGNKTANSATAQINFVGGTGVSTAIAGDDLTITNDAPNVVQEVYKTITGDSGTTTAQLSTSTLNIAGGSGCTSVATSNTLTVNVDVPLPSTSTRGQQLIFDGSDWISAVAHVNFDITSNMSNAYRLSGGGVGTSTDNPQIYLMRGFTYRFVNTTGNAHPFEIRASAGGSAITNGITGSTTGVQYYTIPQTLSPGTTYVYECTAHPAMVGNIVIV